VSLVANRIERRGNLETPRIAWLFGLAAWAIPGAGHLLQRRWLRGALLGGAVWVMFLVGFWLGGHLYTVTGKEEGFGVLLQLLRMIADLGSGLLYVVCWLANVGFAENAQVMTYEYGNTFFLVAGLLNYLAMLDAFDIAAGRKQ
jgi:hypothetical protein